MVQQQVIFNLGKNFENDALWCSRRYISKTLAKQCCIPKILDLHSYKEDAMEFHLVFWKIDFSLTVY